MIFTKNIINNTIGLDLLIDMLVIITFKKPTLCTVQNVVIVKQEIF